MATPTELVRPGRARGVEWGRSWVGDILLPSWVSLVSLKRQNCSSCPVWLPMDCLHGPLLGLASTTILWSLGSWWGYCLLLILSGFSCLFSVKTRNPVLYVCYFSPQCPGILSSFFHAWLPSPHSSLFVTSMRVGPRRPNCIPSAYHGRWAIVVTRQMTVNWLTVIQITMGYLTTWFLSSVSFLFLWRSWAYGRCLVNTGRIQIFLMNEESSTAKKVLLTLKNELVRVSWVA